MLVMPQAGPDLVMQWLDDFEGRGFHSWGTPTPLEVLKLQCNGLINTDQSPHSSTGHSQ